MGNIAVFTVFYLSQVALGRYIETRPALFLPSFVSGRQKYRPFDSKCNHLTTINVSTFAFRNKDLSIYLSNLEVGTPPFYKLLREWDKNG